MWYVPHKLGMKGDNVLFPPAAIARYHHFLHRIRANAVLSWRHAVDPQAFCLVLLQDYGHIWRRGCCCCRIAVRRSR